MPIPEPELNLSVHPEVTPFFDEPTNTLSYVVRDPAGTACAVVDSVMNLDYPSGSISFEGADQIIEFIRGKGLTLEWVLETHVHADHLSAACYLREQLGGRIAIGADITTVQETFAKIFNTGHEFARDGSQFDHLLGDGEEFHIGGMRSLALHTPGHTPACMTYVIGDATFVGDTLFMPDYGTARADFPGGDAGTLYRSIQRILSLPPEMRLFVCHDYLPEGRALEFETTVGAQLEGNVHVRSGISESEYTRMRKARDATLGMPALILPSLQVNMRAGRLPPPEETGQVFLKLPVNAFGGDDISGLLS